MENDEGVQYKEELEGVFHFFAFQLAVWTHVTSRMYLILPKQYLGTNYRFCGCGEACMKEQGYVRDVCKWKVRKS